MSPCDYFLIFFFVTLQTTCTLLVQYIRRYLYILNQRQYDVGLAWCAQQQSNRSNFWAERSTCWARGCAACVVCVASLFRVTRWRGQSRNKWRNDEQRKRTGAAACSLAGK